MIIVSNKEEALEAIAECVKIVNEQLAVAKKLADKFGLTLDVTLNNSTQEIEQVEETWQSSGMHC